MAKKTIKSNKLAMRLTAVLIMASLFFAGPATAENMTDSGPVLQPAGTTLAVNDPVFIGGRFGLDTPADLSNSVATRAERLDQYFSDRDMPLYGYGAEFVVAADNCGLDWRLVAAIGVRESSGGKHLMNNNPFGWGSAKIRFQNFSDAIEAVTANLCGLNPDTARHYAGMTVYQKLWSYNGSVLASYPREVMDIMDRM